MDQLPLPSLQIYSVFSGFSLFYAVVYGLTVADGFFNTLWKDVWFTAAVLNFGYCVFFHFVCFIHEFVFGVLQTSEKKHMQDTFWNFVFYKFIFVFGVMNVQDMREMLSWSSWFSLVGALVLTSQLCKDRFQYLSFSPTTTTSSHAMIIILLSVLLVACAGLFMVCAIVGWQFGFNYFAFLFSEVYTVFAKTLHTLIKYIIHLWDMHHVGLWENRNTYTYYTELILEMSSLCVDFLHHSHMLVWANMFLSVASLILLMKLRYLYQEIQRKMKRHHNYVMVNKILDKCFQPMTSVELQEEVCPVCWEVMTSARKLPCGHAFHLGCLRSWLEQDPVCPTCRFSLSGLMKGEVSEQVNTQQQRSRRRNWLLYFNGASIASWLPTFSLEVHHPTNQQDFNRNVEEIHTLFPHISIHTISTDLNTTNSVTQTIDNILSGAVIDTLDQPHPVTHPLPTNQSLSSTHIVQESSLDSRSDEPASTQTSDIKGFNNELRQRIRLEKYNEDEKDNSISTQGSSSSNDIVSNGDLTFEDKKKRLILEARRRYLDRHHIDSITHVT